MHSAAAGGSPAILQRLLDLGVEASARTVAGKTPLHFAAASPNGVQVSAPLGCCGCGRGWVARLPQAPWAWQGKAARDVALVGVCGAGFGLDVCPAPPHAAAAVPCPAPFHPPPLHCPLQACAELLGLGADPLAQVGTLGRPAGLHGARTAMHA